MARRENGTGWVEPNGTGWRARMWLDGSKVSLGTYPTRKEAERVLAAAIAKLAKERGVAGETLGSYAARWIDRYEIEQRDLGLKRSGPVLKRSHINSRILPHAISRQPLAAITPGDVRAWIADQLKEKTVRRTRPAQTTLSNPLSTLRMIFDDAVKAGILQVNPAHGVKVKRQARTEEPWTWLYVEELKALTSPRNEEADLFLVAAMTGLRRGELYGLHWRDVDLTRAQVTVRFSYDEATKAGRVRAVPLLAPVVEALRRQRARWPANALVFPNLSGGMRTQNQTPDVGAAMRAIKVERRVRFHDLRHTCASHLLQGTWAPRWIAQPLSLEQLKGWLGHSTIQMVERYAHLGPNSLASLVARATPKRDAAPLNTPLNISSIAEARARKVSKPGKK